MKKSNFSQLIASIGIMAPGLALLLFLGLCGCGSESKQSAPQASDKAKPAVDQSAGKSKVVEIPQGKEPLAGKTVEEKAQSTKLPVSQLLDEEVIPPATPGGKGITRRELEESKALQPKTDPMDEIVIPPGGPGEKGVTRRQLDQMQKQQTQIDPMDEEVIPPTPAGGKGMTLRELERLKAISPEPPKGPIEPLPISNKPGPSKKPKAD